MSRSPIGLALAAMNRFAGSDLADRLHLRKPAEKLVYASTRTGFRVLSTASREWQRLGKMLPTARLPHGHRSDLFDLSLSEEQQMIVDSFSDFAAEQIRPAAAQAEAERGLPEALWQQIAELGLVQYAVPEAFGGVAQEQSPLTSLLIAETLAQADMGISAAILAPYSVAQAISRWGNGAQQSRYLPAFADTRPPLASIAIDEPQPLFSPDTLKTQAWRDGDGFVLQGAKINVPLAASVELLLIAADLKGMGPRLFIVSSEQAGLRVRDEPAMGLRAAGLGRLTLDKLVLPADALLGDGEPFDYQAFLDYGSLLRCALAVGTSQAVLDYVIPYCNDRVAFGEPISQRQAVAFMIANLAVEIDAMRMLSWRAASRAEQGLPFHREVYLARLLCNDKAMEIGSNGVQLLGGHGFVKEHPVERWYRDLRSVALLHSGLQA